MMANIPLPPSAFPIGNKAGATATLVVAVLVGLALFMASRQAHAGTASSKK